jgi:hypothetical protein
LPEQAEHHFAFLGSSRASGRSEGQAMLYPIGILRWVVLTLAVLFCLPGLALSQQLAPALDLSRMQKVLQRRTCPGEPADSLTSVDCRFTPRLRLDEFIQSSLTDQAMLGASFFGEVAQLRNDPAEWSGSAKGLGQRVGIRYVQNLTKGLTMYSLGALVRSDSRSVTYESDPGVSRHCSCVTPRVGHVFLDFATVRKSTKDGRGRRMASPLFAAVVASAIVGDSWYPRRLTSPREIGLRAASSLSVALAGGFYHEFQPEIGRALSWLLGRQ